MEGIDEEVDKTLKEEGTTALAPQRLTYGVSGSGTVTTAPPYRVAFL
ncbi:hypothetical protein [Treponema endosymbiont of Eucomonympha sp.]|nr:hypothetical protein [Treponema endosymbiont of Eucomonympha sp.]